MLTLKFGNDDLGRITTFSAAREGISPDAQERWRAEIEVEAATPAVLEQAMQALRAAQGATGELSLLHEGATVRALAPADCRSGPTFVSLKESDPAPGDAHNRRRVTLEFIGVLQEANAAVQSHEFTLRVETAAGEPAALVTHGRVVLRGGENPADHEALLAAPATGFRRLRQSITRDAAVPALEYETRDEQVFRALPGGVDDGHYVVSDYLGRDGRPMRTLSGFFVGASARARVLELRASDDRLVAQRLDEDPFSRRIDFEFTELAGATESLSAVETLSFTTTRRVVDHPLLDTALPAYRQQVGAAKTEVIQEGSAVGFERHPSPPAPRFGADLVERRVRYSVPRPSLPVDQRWVTSWRYVSRGRASIPAGV